MQVVDPFVGVHKGVEEGEVVEQHGPYQQLALGGARHKGDRLIAFEKRILNKGSPGYFAAEHR